MNWTEIVIKTNREAHDAIFDMLMSIGSGGVAIQDPCDILEKITNIESSDEQIKQKEILGSIDEYIDEELLNQANSMGKDTIILKSYFPESINSVELMQLIKEKLSDISNYLELGDLRVEYSKVKDEDWANNWKKYYNVFNITEKVVIKPS